jgi:hypothetical protein
MPNVLEVAENVVETAWQDHDLTATTFSAPVPSPRRGLGRWLAAFYALRTSRSQARQRRWSRPELHAIDCLAQKYPDVYLLAARS